MTTYQDDPEHWYQKYINEGIAPYDAEEISELAAEEIDEVHFERLVDEASLITTVQNGFCSECSYIFENWPSPSVGLLLIGSYTTSTIKAAAQAGCSCCRLIYTSIQRNGDFDTWRRLERRLQKLNVRSSSYMQLQYMDIGPNATPQATLLGPGVDDKVSIHSQVPLFVRKSPLGSTQIETSFQATANTWIHTCCAEHQHCRSSVQCLQPTRLLELLNDTVRLVIGDELSSTPKYAALSYSWGIKPFFRLTGETMESLLAGISVSILPRLFQDVIKTVQSLDIHHIWIDALCIVQDSESDWRAESARMADVYGGSHLTIAASAARDVHTTLFSYPLASYGFSVQVKGGDVLIFAVLNAVDPAIDGQHLATRAWALQERLLSPRTLHIGGDFGTIWECRSLMASQTLPLGGYRRVPVVLSRSADQSWKWDEVVHAYSTSTLTFKKDKLPALAGLAHRQHLLTNEDYVVGLWKETLIWQLAWYGINASGRRGGEYAQALASVRPPWRAPTWSWMSVDGPIRLDWESKKGTKRFFEIVDVDIELASHSDPYGAIISGKLKIACKHLLRTKIDMDRDDDGARVWNRRFIDLPVPYGKHSIWLDCVEDALLDEQADVWILPLYDDDSSYSDRKNMVSAIVLQQCGAENYYRRVGWFAETISLYAGRRSLGGEHLRHMTRWHHSSTKYEPAADDIVITIV